MGGLLLIGCVTEPAPVTVTFCANQVVGGRLAIRNDAGIGGIPGKWVMVDAPDGKTFSFTAPRRLTIAFTEGETPIASSLRMFQLSADELPKLNCLPNTIGLARDYSVTIAGLGTGRTAELWLGTGALSRGNGSFTLRNSATGASDLVAFQRTGPAFTIEKFIVRRDIDLLSGAALSPIDFASAEARAPRLNAVTFTGAGTETVSPAYRLVTKGTNAALRIVLANGLATLVSLPADLQASGDFYVVGGSTLNFGVGADGRSVAVRFTTPADRSLALGPALVAPTMAFRSTTGPTSVSLTLPVQSEYAERADMTVNQSLDGILLSVTMTMTRSYRGGAAAWNFETPDPSKLLERAAQLDPKGISNWSAYASSGDNSSLFLGTPTTEVTVREAFRQSALSAGPAYHSRIINSYPERSCSLCSRKLPF